MKKVEAQRLERQLELEKSVIEDWDRHRKNLREVKRGVEALASRC